jgi:hypothetical protein
VFCGKSSETFLSEIVFPRFDAPCPRFSPTFTTTCSFSSNDPTWIVTRFSDLTREKRVFTGTWPATHCSVFEFSVNTVRLYQKRQQKQASTTIFLHYNGQTFVVPCTTWYLCVVLQASCAREPWPGCRGRSLVFYPRPSLLWRPSIAFRHVRAARGLPRGSGARLLRTVGALSHILGPVGQEWFADWWYGVRGGGTCYVLRAGGAATVARPGATCWCMGCGVGDGCRPAAEGRGLGSGWDWLAAEGRGLGAGSWFRVRTGDSCLWTRPGSWLRDIYAPRQCRSLAGTRGGGGGIGRLGCSYR